MIQCIIIYNNNNIIIIHTQLCAVRRVRELTHEGKRTMAARPLARVRAYRDGPNIRRKRSLSAWDAQSGPPHRTVHTPQQRADPPLAARLRGLLVRARSGRRERAMQNQVACGENPALSPPRPFATAATHRWQRHLHRRQRASAANTAEAADAKLARADA